MVKFLKMMTGVLILVIALFYFPGIFDTTILENASPIFISWIIISILGGAILIGTPFSTNDNQKILAITTLLGILIQLPMLYLILFNYRAFSLIQPINLNILVHVLVVLFCTAFLLQMKKEKRRILEYSEDKRKSTGEMSSDNPKEGVS